MKIKMKINRDREMRDLKMEFGSKWIVEMKRGLRIERGGGVWRPVSGCHGPSGASAGQEKGPTTTGIAC